MSARKLHAQEGKGIRVDIKHEKFEQSASQRTMPKIVDSTEYKPSLIDADERLEDKVNMLSKELENLH